MKTFLLQNIRTTYIGSYIKSLNRYE